MPIRRTGTASTLAEIGMYPIRSAVVIPHGKGEPAHLQLTNQGRSVSGAVRWGRATVLAAGSPKMNFEAVTHGLSNIDRPRQRRADIVSRRDQLHVRPRRLDPDRPARAVKCTCDGAH
jgi:hypothetical protein